MSLCLYALRFAAVKALVDRTVVGDKVLDSEIGAISVDERGNIVIPEDHRFIAVYTDDTTSDTGDGRQLYENGLVTVRFEFGITGRMIFEEDDPENPGQKMKSVVPGIPDTDAFSEFYLNLVDRQIMSALMDADNEPAQIFRGLLYSVTKIERRRVANADKGQRLAAWQITLTGDLLPDPVTTDDIPIGAPFGRFLALLDAGTGDERRVAAMIRAELAAPGADWQDAAARLGFISSELSALGIGPQVDGAEEVTVDGAEIAVDGHGAEMVE